MTRRRCDRQAVSDAFLVDPDLRDMDKFDDKVERLQRIMKAKRELVKLGHEIATTQGAGNLSIHLWVI